MGLTAFLDVLIEKKNDCSTGHSVYQKLTDTHTDSSDNFRLKHVILISLMDRPCFMHIWTSVSWRCIWPWVQMIFRPIQKTCQRLAKDTRDPLSSSSVNYIFWECPVCVVRSILESWSASWKHQRTQYYYCLGPQKSSVMEHILTLAKHTVLFEVKSCIVRNYVEH